MGILLGVFSLASILPRPRIGRIVNVGVVFATMIPLLILLRLARALRTVLPAR
jgi:hypothetical protein